MKSRQVGFHLFAAGILVVMLTNPFGILHKTKQNEKSARTLTGVDTSVPIVGTVPMVDFDEQYYIEQEQVKTYLAAVEQQRLADEYQKALDEQRIINEQSARRPAPARVNVSTPSSGSGDCAGVAAIVGWGTVQHESGGNPMAENGIYKGCAQIGLPWWNGACSGLNWTSVTDQATCAQIVMNTQGPSAWTGTYSR